MGNKTGTYVFIGLMACVSGYWAISDFRAGDTRGAMIAVALGVGLTVWRLKRASG